MGTSSPNDNIPLPTKKTHSQAGGAGKATAGEVGDNAAGGKKVKGNQQSNKNV